MTKISSWLWKADLQTGEDEQADSFRLRSADRCIRTDDSTKDPCANLLRVLPQC